MRLPRYTARHNGTTWAQIGESGATGGDVSNVLEGDGGIQVYRPTCAGPERRIQRWSGTAWSAPLVLPINADFGELLVQGGQVYFGYSNFNASRGNVAALNVP